MARQLARPIATMTELRDPRKGLDRAGGEPVAVLKNSGPVAVLVPAGRVAEAPGHRHGTLEEVEAHLRESGEPVQPVLEAAEGRVGRRRTSSR